MLQTIRERLTGWVAVVILGLIALTLVLTFGAIDTGFTSAGTAATVNGEDISQNDFRRIYQRQRQEWEQNYRAQIPDVLAEQMANQVVDTLVRNRIVAQHVRESGYRVNNDEVFGAIERTPAFQVGGRFSRPQYESLLSSQGMSPQRFEYEQRQDMQISQFIEGLSYTAFYTPSEFRRYVELDGETRDIDYVVLPAANWLDDVEVNEEQIRANYELNQSAYMTQESAAIEYVEIKFADILSTVSITEADALEYYSENPQEFGGPEERQASHILILLDEDEVVAEQKAVELRARLDSGESFAALAAQYSADTGSASNGGDLGWLGAGDAPAPEFEEALFALEVGGVSDPVRTQFGFHLIRLEGLRSGAKKDFPEVKAELIERLRENTAADFYADLVDELDELALESIDGLAPVAESMNLALGTVNEFTRSGGDPLGTSPDLISAVFSLEVLEDGENSPVIDLGEGRAAVVRVTEHRLARARPLEEVSEQIIATIRGEESIRLVAEQGDALLADLNADSDSASVALPAGVQWLDAKGIRRGSQELAADLTAEIFRTPNPDALAAQQASAYKGLLLASGDFAVFRVTAVQSGRPELYTQEDRDLRKRQLAGRLGGSQAAALVEGLVQDASVSVSGDLLGQESNQL